MVNGKDFPTIQKHVGVTLYLYTQCSQYHLFIASPTLPTLNILSVLIAMLFH